MDFSNYKNLSDKKLKQIGEHAIQAKKESILNGETYVEASRIMEAVLFELQSRGYGKTIFCPVCGKDENIRTRFISKSQHDVICLDCDSVFTVL